MITYASSAPPQQGKHIFRPALYVLGLLLCVMGAAMLIPGLVDAAAGDPDATGFFLAAGFTGLLGLLLVFTNRGAGFFCRAARHSC